MSREHLSIGEVLALLQTDFDDITISKIRFLETQGLIDPERTPSGYRKFYPPDVHLLQWVLRQQRDHFLPLRVIRERIDAGDHLIDDADTDTSTASSSAEPNTDSGSNRPAPPSSDPADLGGPTLFDGGPGSVALTIDELAHATGLSPSEISELERYGFITSRKLGQGSYFDGDALIVGRLAAKFAEVGVEARHLRMYKTAAEREASVFEQVVTPLVRQRNPAARKAAVDQLEELAQMGARMRAAMIRQALSHHLDP